MEKSGILRFSRGDVKGSQCFTFLGFEFYWARNNRSRPLRELAAALRRRFTGYFNYYGVIGNSERLWAGFLEMWKTLAIPNQHIVEKPYQRIETWNLTDS